MEAFLPLRKDFIPADKILAEDDITVSTVAPIHLLNEIGPGTLKNQQSLFTTVSIDSFKDPMMRFTEVLINKRKKIFREREILSVILNASIKKMQKNKYQKRSLLKSIPTRCRN